MNADLWYVIVAVAFYGLAYLIHGRHPGSPLDQLLQELQGHKQRQDAVSELQDLAQRAKQVLNQAGSSNAGGSAQAQSQ
jgi:hypothetical protein